MQSNNKSDFKEANTRVVDDDRREFLTHRINELSLKIQGTRLEALINQLYQELASRGLSFRPKCYLSDEWGCPHGVPVIGIPFYLADPRLSQLEGELTGIEAENEAEIIQYLRHESGHAFNYAYKLYRQSEWRGLFGLFSRPYKENYRPKPFSPSFVRHLPGWYSQKHPDEDFAETFAVWLTPFSNWENIYRDTPALTKLLYVDRVTKELGSQMPMVTEEIFDSPIEEMNETLRDWYEIDEKTKKELNLPVIIGEDLRTLFPSTEGRSAASLVQEKRRYLSQTINHWTGVERSLIEALIDEIINRLSVLNLKIEIGRDDQALTALTVFLTTLAANYLYSGDFVKL